MQYASLEELRKKNYEKQFTAVTTHKNVQNYYNKKCAKYFVALKGDAKFEEKLTCSLENDMRNFANFDQSTRKCQNRNFDKILLTKVENV